MKHLLFTYIIMIGALFTACNHEVFVERPEVEEPPVDNPEPDPDPEIADSLILKSFIYDESSLTLASELRVQEAISSFENHTASRGVSVLYNNYNSSIVYISNSTYYAIPWAKTGQPDIEVPGLDSEGVPGFYGTVIPFAFGSTVVPRQYMADHREDFDLPPYSKVTATIYTTYRVVTASADIEFFIASLPSYLDDGRVTVRVAVPVDIKVKWSEITPVK